MSKKIDLRAEFEAAIGRFNPTREGRRDFRIKTSLGPLDVCIYVEKDGSWIAAVWDDVDAVANHFGVKSFMSGDRLNPCSGKWNWHWLQFWPCGIKALKADREEAGRKMIAAFVKKVEELV